MHSAASGAAVPVVCGTAYEALIKQGHIDQGAIVVIHGAAGAVGRAAVQLAVHKKAIIIGTASASKHGGLREHGVHYTIDYRTEDVPARAREITGGKGVDVMANPAF